MRLWRWLRGLHCSHEGLLEYQMTGRMAGITFEVWRCTRCGTPFFYEDDQL